MWCTIFKLEIPSRNPHFTAYFHIQSITLLSPSEIRHKLPAFRRFSSAIFSLKKSTPMKLLCPREKTTRSAEIWQIASPFLTAPGSNQPRPEKNPTNGDLKEESAKSSSPANVIITTEQKKNIFLPRFDRANRFCLRVPDGKVNSWTGSNWNLSKSHSGSHLCLLGNPSVPPKQKRKQLQCEKVTKSVQIVKKIRNFASENWSKSCKSGFNLWRKSWRSGRKWRFQQGSEFRCVLRESNLVLGS